MALWARFPTVKGRGPGFKSLALTPSMNRGAYDCVSDIADEDEREAESRILVASQLDKMSRIGSVRDSVSPNLVGSNEEDTQHSSLVFACMCAALTGKKVEKLFKKDAFLDNEYP